MISTNLEKNSDSDLKVLGNSDGYQHLWKESKGKTREEKAQLTWLKGNRFYSLTSVDQDEDFYDLVMNVNFKGTVFVTQAFKPMMGKGASIVNFASQAGRDGGGPGSALYASSKGAVMTLTRNWAKEFGPQGIRINAVCPGMIATKFHDDFTADQVREKVAGVTPLRREGTAEEVADLVAYLAGDESSSMTGNNLDINERLAFS